MPQKPLKYNTSGQVEETSLLAEDVSGVVSESDYSSAHSILVQQSGTGSPTILQVGNNTLIGRLSGGGSAIDDLSATDVRTLLSINNVDNTSDLNKPISTATQTALNLKYDASNPNNYINASTPNTFTADQTMGETLTINKDVVFDGPVNAGNSGTSINIDWTNGNRQVMTMTGNCTVTFTNPPGACNLLIKLVQDATGSRTITFPAAVKFPAGVEPVLTTTANAEDIVSFYFDGTTYYGIPSYNFQ